MKHLFRPEKPDCVHERWPGEFTVFSWLDKLFTLPRPVSIITTRKENGAPNACPDMWGMLIGGGTEYSSLIAVNLHYHTYANILREKEWCINLPGSNMESKWHQTIARNGAENDEISDAGFTVEPGQTVKAPRIVECLVNLECRLEWDRPLYEGSNLRLFCGRVTAVAVSESLVGGGPEERLRALDLSYTVQSQLNPLTGDALSPSHQLTILRHDLH